MIMIVLSVQFFSIVSRRNYTLHMFTTLIQIILNTTKLPANEYNHFLQNSYYIGIFISTETEKKTNLIDRALTAIKLS